MDLIKNFFNNYGSSILNSVYLCLMGCFSYIGIKIKKSIEKYENDRIKKE